MTQVDENRSRPTTVPTVACAICGEWLEVRPDGRGFPPDIAKRRLKRDCRERGHAAEVSYRAGITFSRPQGMGGGS